jgi:hypothetical protein
MTTVKHAIHEHDVVALRNAVDKVQGTGQWPAGTTGTVVDERGADKLIEIYNDRGETLDFISQPEDKLKLVTPKYPHLA